MLDLTRFYPLLRPMMHAWFLLSRGMTLGVRAAIVSEGKIMLVRHTYVGGWQLPGGGVELGEDAETAMTREVREEAAILIGAPPRLHGVFHNRAVSGRDHVLVYVVDRFDVLGPKVPDREIAEARFFPLDDLPAATTPGTRRRLHEIASGLRPSRAW